MRFTFISNYLNHHQLPFCLEMKKRLGDDFCFVATEPFNQERMQVGYVDMNSTYDFVICAYENDRQRRKAMDLCVHADVMMFGSCLEAFFYRRILENPRGLTLRYSERVYKETGGKLPLKNPFFYWSRLVNTLVSRPNYLLLAASGYAPYDYVRTGFCGERIYKWGYFPQSSTNSLEKLLDKKRGQPLRLVWVGRFIDWKRPGDVLEVADRLRQTGALFVVHMIGDGPLREQVEQKIEVLHMERWVHCTGGLPNDIVRKEMEESHIHLFTSDYNEGWGSVLNESMASACVPVCSVAVGAAPFLIRHGENGFVYETGNIEQIFSLCQLLIKDANLLERLQRNAFKQIHERWNAAAAAENLLMLCRRRLDEQSDGETLEGPCAKAKYIRQSDVYPEMTKGWD